MDRILRADTPPTPLPTSSAHRKEDALRVTGILADSWVAAERLFARHPDPVLMLDTNGRIVGALRGFQGLSPDQLRSSPFTGLVSPDFRGIVDAAIKDAVSPALTHTMDVPLTGDAQPASWFQATMSPVLVSGRVEGVLVTMTDVTDRHAEEDRLRRSERLMVDTQGVAHMGTWEWDPREPAAKWSAEMYRIYGLPPTHTPTYQDYLERVHPDDRERVRLATERVFNELKPYSHDERVTRGDGELRYLHTWAEPVLDERGNLVRLVGVCQDITDSKRVQVRLEEREARLRAIFHRAPYGIASVRLDGTFGETNEALEMLLGYTESELRTRTLFDVQHEDDLPGNRDAIKRLAAGAGVPECFEARFVRSDGSNVWVRMTLNLVRPEEADAFIVGVFEDVTAARRADEAQKVAESRLDRIRELEEVSEWKSHLMNVASHEIKNPLTPIILQLHLLSTEAHGPLNPAQRASVERVSKQADRLKTLVHDILDVARIEHGRLAVTPVPVDLTALARRVAETFRVSAEKWGIRIETVIEDGVSGEADPDRIEQVLFNLLGNALKFTPSGGVVTLHMHALDDQVHLAVEDTGPGVAAELRGKLFEPFSTVTPEGVTAPREPGTGLGLFISKNIVDAHGGRIWVDSTPGAGATFHVVVPRDPVRTT